MLKFREIKSKSNYNSTLQLEKIWKDVFFNV